MRKSEAPCRTSMTKFHFNRLLVNRTMAADLARYRDRLKDARRYLVGRIAEDEKGSRRAP